MNYPGWRPTGILIDNAVDLVQNVIPVPTVSEMKKALLNAQNNCFEVGLTTVDDAGLMKNVIDFSFFFLVKKIFRLFKMLFVPKFIDYQMVNIQSHNKITMN